MHMAVYLITRIGSEIVDSESWNGNGFVHAVLSLVLILHAKSSGPQDHFSFMSFLFLFLSSLFHSSFSFLLFLPPLSLFPLFSVFIFSSTLFLLSFHSFLICFSLLLFLSLRFQTWHICRIFIEGNKCLYRLFNDAVSITRLRIIRSDGSLPLFQHSLGNTE